MVLLLYFAIRIGLPTCLVMLFGKVRIVRTKSLVRRLYQFRYNEIESLRFIFNAFMIMKI